MRGWDKDWRRDWRDFPLAITAHHEAGHVVVARALGVPVTRMTIEARPQSDIHSRYYPPEIRAIIAAAGWAAEDILDDEPYGRFEDRVEAGSLFNEWSHRWGATDDSTMFAKAVGAQSGDWLTLMNDAHLRAREILEERWRAVEMLAWTLLVERQLGSRRDKGRLGSERIDALIEIGITQH